MYLGLHTQHLEPETQRGKEKKRWRKRDALTEKKNYGPKGLYPSLRRASAMTRFPASLG